MHYNFKQDIYSNKRYYVQIMVGNIRQNGTDECWILNKQYSEIYSFKSTRVSEFDVQITITNCLAFEQIFNGIFVLHMKDKIFSILAEIPGTIYISKLDCFRSLYDQLKNSVEKTKNKKKLAEIFEKINYIESNFPQLII